MMLTFIADPHVKCSPYDTACRILRLYGETSDIEVTGMALLIETNGKAMS
jgi:hypothetical protein